MKKWLEKYLLTLIPIFTISFMGIIFGPTEIFFGNYKEFGFVYGEFGPTFIIAGTVCALLVTVVISLLPEILHKGILTLVQGTIIAAYVQSMFLNKGLEQLGVTAEGYRPEQSIMVKNAIVWFLILGLTAIIAFSKKTNYKKVIAMISGFLLVLGHSGEALKMA